MAEVIGRLFDKECRASVSKIDFEGVDTMGSHSMNPTIMLSYG